VTATIEPVAAQIDQQLAEEQVEKAGADGIDLVDVIRQWPVTPFLELPADAGTPLAARYPSSGGLTYV
jgi:hypothetical protein